MQYKLIKNLYYIKIKDQSIVTPKLEKEVEKLKGIKKYISGSIRPSIEDQELASKYYTKH